MKKKLLLDVSLGRDSFYSIMTAFQNENTEIEAITVQDPLMDRTCHGMLHLLEHLYTDIPVCKGRINYLNDLEKNEKDASRGKWPDDKTSLISADEMIYLKANQYTDNLTIISHSPLTNIALFLRNHKDSEGKINKLIILENRTPLAISEGLDFQPNTDIDAAKEVLTSKLDICFIPKELLTVNADNKALINYIKNGTDTMIGRFLRHSKMPDNDEAILCGIAGILTAVSQDAFKSVRMDVSAVTEGKDKGNYFIGKEKPSSNVSVVTFIDYKKALIPGFGVTDTAETIAYNKLHEGEHHHHD